MNGIGIRDPLSPANEMVVDAHPPRRNEALAEAAGGQFIPASDPRRRHEPMNTQKSPLPILLIGTAGTEVAPFVPPDQFGRIHSAQAWAPRKCSCGDVHAACAPAALAILVGRPQAGVHLDPAACGLAVSRHDSPWNSTGISEVLVPDRDFNPAALQVVRHAISGPTTRGVVGFSLSDVVSVVLPARRLRFARATSARGVVDAARLVAADASWISADTRSATIGIWGNTRTTLMEISDAGQLLEERLPEAQLFFYSPLTDGEPEVSILGA